MLPAKNGLFRAARNKLRGKKERTISAANDASVPRQAPRALPDLNFCFPAS
jgi:hypothetical protein